MGSPLEISGQPSREEKHQCILVITAPSDRVVYQCFRSIARRWRGLLSAHRLWIVEKVPLSSGICLEEPSAAIARILDANCDMISLLELEFGSLVCTYVRSGG